MPAIDLSKLKDIKLDKTKKEVLILIITGLIVFVVLYFQIFLKSAIAELFTLVPEARNLKADIKKTKEDLKYEAILKKRFESMEGKIGIYGKKLPAEQDIPILLRDLSNMARDSYVKILGINPMSSRKSQSRNRLNVYQEIPIMISARSGYHELGTFIDKIENADRFMEISDIKMKSNPSSLRRHDIELVVSTYVLLKK